MVAWRAVVDSEPEFAQRVRTIMDAHRHKTIATLHALGAPPDQGSDLFRADIDEVVVTRVGDPPDHLVIELWRPDRPLHRIERR